MICEKILGKVQDPEFAGKEVDYVDFQWDEAMARLAKLPRQAEWEAFVSKFQGCPADARSDEKWQPMERMFRLY